MSFSKIRGRNNELVGHDDNEVEASNRKRYVAKWGRIWASEYQGSL